MTFGATLEAALTFAGVEVDGWMEPLFPICEDRDCWTVKGVPPGDPAGLDIVYPNPSLNVPGQVTSQRRKVGLRTPMGVLAG